MDKRTKNDTTQSFKCLRIDAVATKIDVIVNFKRKNRPNNQHNKHRVNNDPVIEFEMLMSVHKTKIANN